MKKEILIRVSAILTAALLIIPYILMSSVTVKAADEDTITWQGCSSPPTTWTFPADAHIQMYTFVSDYSGPPKFVSKVLVSDKPFSGVNTYQGNSIKSCTYSEHGFYYFIASSPTGGWNESQSEYKNSTVYDLSGEKTYKEIIDMIPNLYFDTSVNSYTEETKKDLPYFETKEDYDSYMLENHPDIYFDNDNYYKVTYGGPPWNIYLPKGAHYQFVNTVVSYSSPPYFLVNYFVSDKPFTAINNTYKRTESPDPINGKYYLNLGPTGSGTKYDTGSVGSNGFVCVDLSDNYSLNDTIPLEDINLDLTKDFYDEENSLSSGAKPGCLIIESTPDPVDPDEEEEEKVDTSVIVFECSAILGGLMGLGCMSALGGK